MVNFSIINCQSDDQLLDMALRNQIESVFRYVTNVNVHIIYNLISPINAIGLDEFIMFIDIPNEKGNYYRTIDRQYLSTLAIAVRRFEDSDIIDCDNDNLYTEDGIWDYRKEIEIV